MGLFKNDPKTLGESLRDFLDAKGLTEKVVEASAPIIWEKILGGATTSKVVSLKNGVLRVECDSSSWRTELKIREKDLIRKMNKELKRNIVKKIIFK